MGKCRRGYSEAIAAVAEIDAAAIVQELKDLRQNDEDEEEENEIDTDDAIQERVEYLAERLRQEITEEIEKQLQEERPSESTGGVPMPQTPALQGDDEWRSLGRVTVDTAALLLIDPIHVGMNRGERISASWRSV